LIGIEKRPRPSRPCAENREENRDRPRFSRFSGGTGDTGTGQTLENVVCPCFTSSPCFSSYEEARRLAFGRERAWHDEAQFLLEAREEGRKEGRDDALHQTATNLIRNTGLDNASIAAVTALDIGEIAALRGDV
jgi:hypothetical protein